MTPPIPEALRRVILVEDTSLDAAATITVDYTGGGDLARLTLNPEIAPPESVEGYRIRAAVHAALEGFRRYNRAVTRTYGTYEREQRLFEEAFERAVSEFEQLVHLTPTGGTVPALQLAPPAEEPLDQALPDEFPEVEALREIGVRTYQAVQDATDAALRTAPGVGIKRLEAIRKAAARHLQDH